MKKRWLAVAALLVLAWLGAPAWAETYYVDQNHPQANDTNPGTKDTPWRTIGHAEDVAANPGDVVYVRSGTYDERVTCRHSGSAAGGFIHFVGYPGDAKPIMRGFEIQNQSYIRIIGFEITHNSTDYRNGITLYSFSSHVEILDNYFHHISGTAVQLKYQHSISHITVRGNHMYYLNCPSDVVGECTGGGGLVSIDCSGGYFLVEYNEGHRAGDYINVTAPYNIVRNNHLYDYRNSYFPDGVGDGNHVDMFQPMGAGYDHYSRYHVYESNFMGDNIERNSHILQMRTDDSSEHHVIFRGNVGYNHGSYAMQCGGADNVYFYNNTLYRMNYPGGTGNATSYNAESGEYALNNYNFNNIYSETGGNPIAVQSGNSCTSSNNLCYSLTAGHASCVSFSNPLFSDSGSHDYRLQSGSPAIGLGKAVTTVTSPGGSGMSFDVADAGFFCDGYGIAEGDLIKVGNSPARITVIATNTITVDRSITWNNGDGIHWRNQDASPDIGAYEFRAGGYGFAIEITGPTDQENVSGLVPITAVLTNAENVRFVIFYIDGIPAAKVTESPYSYTWDTANLGQGSRHLIEARAYALLATPRMTESDQIVAVVGPAIEPQAPAELYIISKTSSSVRLGWLDSSGAFGYRIYRDGLLVGDTIDNRYTDNGLASDTEYNYTVTALGSGGFESAQSSGVTVTTPGSGGGSGDSGSGGGGGGGGCFINTAMDETFPGLPALVVITAILGLIGFMIMRNVNFRPLRIIKRINRR